MNFPKEYTLNIAVCVFHHCSLIVIGCVTACSVLSSHRAPVPRIPITIETNGTHLYTCEKRNAGERPCLSHYGPCYYVATRNRFVCITVAPRV